MTTSNRLAITELAETQNNRHATVNEAIAKLEAGAGQFGAVSVGDNAPPGSPSEGDIYVVGTAGSGAWSGHNEQVAVYYNAAWLFLPALDGMMAYAADEDAYYYFDGTDWTALNIGGGGTLPTKATAAEVRSSAAGNLYVAAEIIESASALVALTDAATIAVDWDTGIVFSVTLGGNRTLGNPTNGQPGTWRTIIVTQDGTGSRTLAYGANYKHPAGTAPTLTTDIAAVDVLSILCVTSSLFYVFSALDLS